MISEDKLKTLIGRIEYYASSHLRLDPDEEGIPLTALDISGGNYDDAYSAGEDDGYTRLARELLEIINV